MRWALLRFGLLIGSAVPLALRQAEIWKKPPEQLLVACLLTIAFVGAAEPVGKRVQEKRIRVADANRERLRQVMTMALVEISHLTSLPCQDVGVHMYVIRHPFPRRLRQPELDRILRVRLSSMPEASDIKWTHGKGVVGACWQQQRGVSIDVHALHSEHYACDEATWGTLEPAVTLGLSYADFKRTRGKYGVILATPITRATGGIVGVVSVDGPCERSGALETAVVQRRLRTLADDLQRHLNG